MKNLLRALAVVAFSMPALALAQTTGTLSGQMFDSTGQPLRGIKVVASSETQIGGAKSTATGDDGTFRVSGLTPGKFTVTASAPKFRSVVLTNIKITPNTTTELQIVMEVETATDEVRVVEKAPVVNTSSTAVGETFDEDFLNQLPIASRDYQGVMALTPGVVDIDGSGNPQSRGGTFFNNSYTVDGFQTTDPVTHTFGQNFSFNAMSAVQVETAGSGAEHSDTLGAATNIVTKSGSNRLEFDGGGTYTDENMRLFKDARDRGNNRSVTMNLNVGGPILKDRLWFYVSAELISNTFTLPKDPEFGPHPTASVLALNSFAKLAWQVSTRNKVDLRLSYSAGDFRNRIQSYLVEPEAEQRQLQRTTQVGLQWTSLLTDKLFLQTRVGFQDIRLDVGPQSCVWDPEHCTDRPAQIDVLTGIERQNYSNHSVQDRRTGELSGHLEWFGDSTRWGSHAVKVGAKFEAHENPFKETVPGDYVYYSRGPEPFLRTDTCSNDPKLARGDCRHNWLYSLAKGNKLLLFLEDNFRPTRYLSIQPGLGLHRGHSSDDRERIVTDIDALTPHLNVVWDPTHDGRTAIRGSINSRVDTGFLALAGFLSRTLYERRCQWDPDVKDYVRNCTSQGGDSGTTVGMPCGPGGTRPDGSPCQSKLSPARLWEVVLGAEREILTGVSLGVNFIYRKFVHQFEDVETNAYWNQGGTDLRREANYKSGRPEFIFDLQTPSSAVRRYEGVDAILRKKEGIIRALASYTWSRYEGVADSTFASTFLDNPGQAPYYYGPLRADIRHSVQLNGSYFLKPWLSLGVGYEFQSGGPYNRLYFDPVYSSFSSFQSKRGYDSRGTLNPDDDTPLRLPDISMLNAQVRANLQPLINQKLELWAESFNLLALRTTTSVIEQDGQFFGRSARRLPPMSVRVGVRYRF